MKKQIQIVGILAALLFFVGIIFKGMHWPGAARLIGLGVLLGDFYMLLFIISGTSKFKKGLDKGMAYLGAFTFIIVLTGFLFKISHWPGANILILASNALLLILSLLLMASAFREIDTSKQNLKAFFGFAIFILTSILWFLSLDMMKHIISSL